MVLENVLFSLDFFELGLSRMLIVKYLRVSQEILVESNLYFVQKCFKFQDHKSGRDKNCLDYIMEIVQELFQCHLP